MPTSLARIRANKINALASTGPRTLAGRARSAMNALKSGVHARLVVITALGERAEELDEFRAKFWSNSRRWEPSSANSWIDSLFFSGDNAALFGMKPASWPRCPMNFRRTPMTCGFSMPKLHFAPFRLTRLLLSDSIIWRTSQPGLVHLAAYQSAVTAIDTHNNSDMPFTGSIAERVRFAVEHVLGVVTDRRKRQRSSLPSRRRKYVRTIRQRQHHD